MIAIGTIIADKYRVDEMLGEGAMGAVVAATHLELDKRVAIKLVKPEVAHPSGLDRFVQEARGVAKLRNEHVCQVTDFGRLADGAPYIVMERLDGETLEQRLGHGPLPVGEVARYVLEICEALDEAHAAGIVHRDLKPGNVFRVRKSNGTAHIKVLDFGVSKFQRDAGAFATTDFAVIGTPAYMSPEQLRSSRDVDPRSDLWAIGVVMYQALTGALPFDGETFIGLCTAIASESPRSLRERRPDVPVAIEKIVMRCLHKAPDGRFPSSAALASALAPHADAVVPWRPSAVTPAPTVQPLVATTLGAGAGESIQTSPLRSRRAGFVAAMAIACAAAAIVLVAAIELAKRRPPDASSSVVHADARDATADAVADAVADVAIDAPLAIATDASTVARDAALAKRPHAVVPAPPDAATKRARCATDDPMCAFSE